MTGVPVIPSGLMLPHPKDERGIGLPTERLAMLCEQRARVSIRVTKISAALSRFWTACSTYRLADTSATAVIIAAA